MIRREDQLERWGLTLDQAAGLAIGAIVALLFLVAFGLGGCMAAVDLGGKAAVALIEIAAEPTP